ncbi:hypothetical protein [Streptomyces sp. NRRL F-525]|uniref:hypothetical protein n=1 Tax=Streptomyces sp. NRRL F-525 TaxID=1463861 RepID=UPI001F2FD064|nr:hypothetical protein [Streptomyces sp. NRRL F-525]
MTAPEATLVAVDEVEELAVDGLRWLIGAARETSGGGLAWSGKPSDGELTPMLYSGTAGHVPALLEAWRHFGDDSYADAALRAGLGLADSSTASRTTPSTSAAPEWPSSCGPCTKNSGTRPRVPPPTARCTSCGRASTEPAGARCSS